MRLALLKGNRFNPWHLQAFKGLRGSPSITAFRAESEIQEYFDQRDDNTLGFPVERIYFDTQVGNPAGRWMRTFQERYFGREPRIVPFFERLECFDVLQSWELFTDWSAQALQAKQRFGIPLAVMVWDNIPFNMERNPARRELKQRVAANGDVFLVHTERTRRMLDMEGVSAGQVVKFNPGVDLDLFSPGKGPREALGLAEDEFVILFVGWLLPRKGVHFLIFALRELLNDPALKSRRVRLLIVGSSPGAERVERLIARVGVEHACTFAGSLPYNRMPEAFRAADLFVLPSIATPEWQEQFGMSLLEAMACGVPVISTLTGAIPEIAGESAVVCQPNDFFALYGALKRLILDPAERADLGAAGRARAEAHFGLQEYARALSDVYDGLLGA